MDYWEPGKPCTRCGVRSTVSCRHRPAERAQVAYTPKVDGRLNNNRNVGGMQFKIAAANKDKSHSFWGRLGNPSSSEAAPILKAAIDALKRKRDAKP